MKHTFLACLLILCTQFSFAQEKKYQLSTPILNISEGIPAADVTIKLERMDSDSNMWLFMSEKKTMESGRVNDFLGADNNNNGIYKLTFFVSDYFKKENKETFYPSIEVVFQIKDDADYHVPITLSAFGYSTYRGS